MLFANFAEALAEGRSKAQAASLRSAKKDVMAKKLNEPHPKSPIRITTATELSAVATSCWSRPAT